MSRHAPQASLPSLGEAATSARFIYRLLGNVADRGRGLSERAAEQLVAPALR